jgi:hypothetical protein
VIDTNREHIIKIKDIRYAGIDYMTMYCLDDAASELLQPQHAILHIRHNTSFILGNYMDITDNTNFMITTLEH